VCVCVCVCVRESVCVYYLVTLSAILHSVQQTASPLSTNLSILLCPNGIWVRLTRSMGPVKSHTHTHTHKVMSCLNLLFFLCLFLFFSFLSFLLFHLSFLFLSLLLSFTL